MVPLCVLAAAGIDALCSRLTEKGWRWAAWTLIGVCGLAVLLVGATTIVAAQKAAEDGAGGYHRWAWMESPTLERLRGEGLPQTLPIYSNAHDALYLLLGKEASLAPRRRANNQPADATGEAVRLQALRCVWPQEGDAWLIWLERQQRDYLFTQEELATIATVQEVARYDDGAIYRVSGCR